MKNNVVEVKQEHIDNGVQGCPCYCAVSLAVYDALADKYKFTDSQSLDICNEEVLIGESWVETAVQGSGAEISIYTKIRGIDSEMVVEDFIAIDNSQEAIGLYLDDLKLEQWIANFDTFEDSEPTSFKIEDIHRINK